MGADPTEDGIDMSFSASSSSSPPSASMGVLKEALHLLIHGLMYAKEMIDVCIERLMDENHAGGGRGGEGGGEKTRRSESER